MDDDDEGIWNDSAGGGNSGYCDTNTDSNDNNKDNNNTSTNTNDTHSNSNKDLDNSNSGSEIGKSEKQQTGVPDTTHKRADNCARASIDSAEPSSDEDVAPEAPAGFLSLATDVDVTDATIGVTDTTHTHHRTRACIPTDSVEPSPDEDDAPEDSTTGVSDTNPDLPAADPDSDIISVEPSSDEDAAPEDSTTGVSDTNQDLLAADFDSDIIDLTEGRRSLLPVSPPSTPSPLSSPPPTPPDRAQEPKRKKKKPKPDLMHVPPLDPDSLGAADFLSASLLAFPAPGKTLADDARTRAVAAMSIFNGVVWFERSYYFKMMTTPPSLGEATNWIADLAVFDHAATFGAKKARGLGKAGTRTQAQKVAAREYGADLIAAIKPKSLVAFTDGASKGNPGPSGAGAYLYDNISPYWDRESSAALGHGTNNLGELWGLGMALQMAKERVLSHPDHYNHLYIFTDSQFSLGIVTDGWRSRSHPDLAMKLKLLVRHFPIPTTIAWVPAHCGIDSNERADELADRGAITSGKKGADVDPSSDFTTSNFVPRIYDG